MGSFNFIPLPNAIPTAVKSGSGTKLEGNNNLAPKLDGKSFQTILAQASGTAESNQQQVSIEFEELPKELQQLIKEKFGIQNTEDIKLIQLPEKAVRVDQNGELRISIDEAGEALHNDIKPKEFGEFVFNDLKNKVNENSEDNQEVEPQFINKENTEEKETQLELIGDVQAPPIKFEDKSSTQPVKEIVSESTNQNHKIEKSELSTFNNKVDVENEEISEDYPKSSPHFIRNESQNELGNESKVTYLFNSKENENISTEKTKNINRFETPVPAQKETESPQPTKNIQSKEIDTPQPKQNIQPTPTNTLNFTPEGNTNQQNLHELDINALNNQTSNAVETNNSKINTKPLENTFQSNTSQVIYYKSETTVEEPKLPSLLANNTLEVTGENAEELAEEIAKANRRNLVPNTPQDGRDEFVIVKSPVQQTDNDQKPVLFLVNTRDIQVDPEQPAKQTAFKAEAITEKLAAMNGQVKIQSANSENNNPNDSGKEQPDNQSSKNKNAPLNKLPVLSESGLQLSRTLNEQPKEKSQFVKEKDSNPILKTEIKSDLKVDAKPEQVSADTFKSAIKASMDQTALETKAPAEPVEVHPRPENVNISNTSNTSNTASVSAPQDTSNTTSTQQTTNTQTTAKPSTTPEMPQAYKDAATQQIVKSVQSSFGSERSHVSIRLTPEVLGRVDIQLKMENGMMTAHIVAEKESTQAMLEKNSAMLRSALDEKNIQIDKVVISKDSSEYRQPNQEQNKSTDRWREYQQEQHKEQNQSRREQQEQQNGKEDQPDQQNNTWQNITSYMDRFFQRHQA